MKIHPVCALFPDMSKEDFDGLCNDIEKIGVVEPIIVYQGYIIDGKNRWRACEKLGVECPTKEWGGTGSLVEFVVSRNLSRRHLTTSQKAVIAKDMVPMLEREAKARKIAGLRKGDSPLAQKCANGKNSEDFDVLGKKSSETAADMVGVSARTVEQVMEVEKKAPEKIQDIRSGKKTVGKAHSEIKKSAEISPPAEEPPEDGMGRPVIEKRLWPAFRSDEFDNLYLMVQEVRRKLKDLCGKPIGSSLHHQSVDGYLQRAYQEIKHGRPYAPCGYCRTKGCKACNNQGWVTKIVYDNTPKEKRL